jgi:carboxymethylenebutenolidase
MSDVIDPSRSTSDAFNRRVFVGLGAGAVAFGSSIAAALAQADGFGQPHPPIVPEDDPAIGTAHTQLTRPDTTIDAYAAWPKNVTAHTPGVVVTQHIWGVDATIRDTVRRYAKEGFIAIAPNLFARSHAPSGDGTSDISLFRAAATAVFSAPDQVHGDLLAGHDWIAAKAPSGKIGITGFCMGGGIALRQVIDHKDYAACVMFYGDVLQGAPKDQPVTAETFAYAKHVTAPVMGNFGERDTSIKPDDVRAMFALLPVPHDAKIYPEAGHAFFDDTRKAYVGSAASDAWTRTLAWFRTYLT